MQEVLSSPWYKYLLGILIFIIKEIQFLFTLVAITDIIYWNNNEKNSHFKLSIKTILHAGLSNIFRYSQYQGCRGRKIECLKQPWDTLTLQLLASYSVLCLTGQNFGKLSNHTSWLRSRDLISKWNRHILIFLGLGVTIVLAVLMLASMI